MLDLKIPIFQGINGNPSQPGEANHPNASLLCANFNEALERINEVLPPDLITKKYSELCPANNAIAITFPRNTILAKTQIAFRIHEPNLPIAGFLIFLYSFANPTHTIGGSSNNMIDLETGIGIPQLSHGY